MATILFGRDIDTIVDSDNLSELLNRFGATPASLRETLGARFDPAYRVSLVIDEDGYTRLGIRTSGGTWISAWYDDEDDGWHWMFPCGNSRWGEMAGYVYEKSAPARATNVVTFDGTRILNYSPLLEGDSEKVATFEGGGVRASDEGKPRWDLLWPKGVPYEAQPLYKLAMHMTRGAEKYEARNWEKFHTPEALERAMQSKARHHAQDMAGETDEPHNIAEMANCMFVETIRWKIDNEWTPDNDE